jgi:curved DNA-binding protein CbpA
MTEDLYQVIGCSPSSTTEQIRVAYRKLALKHHPDKGGNAETFKQLSRAYQILSDHDLRQKYDQSLPLPEIDLIPPLKVFAECFTQWIQQYPLVEFIFKDSCFDVLNLFNTYQSNPVIEILIGSLTDQELTSPTPEQLLNATQYFSAGWFQQLCSPSSISITPIDIQKKVYVTLDDIYLGKHYSHHFSLTNEDLHLSNDYQIMDPDLRINIPLEHNQIQIESDLHLIKLNDRTCYTQRVNIQLNVITVESPHFIRIGDYDLLLHIDITLDQLTKQPILSVSYLNHKQLSFKNPFNCNLRQLYRIEKIGLPNREARERGSLYLLFNLIIHPNQTSMLLNDMKTSYLYPLIPCDPRYIYRTIDDFEEPETFPILSPNHTTQP